MANFDFMNSIRNNLTAQLNPEASPDNLNTPPGMGNAPAAPKLHVPSGPPQGGVASMIPPGGAPNPTPDMNTNNAQAQGMGGPAPDAGSMPQSTPPMGLNISLADLIQLGFGTYLSGLLNSQAPGGQPAMPTQNIPAAPIGAPMQGV